MLTELDGSGAAEPLKQRSHQMPKTAQPAQPLEEIGCAAKSAPQRHPVPIGRANWAGTRPAFAYLEQDLGMQVERHGHMRRRQPAPGLPGWPLEVSGSRARRCARRSRT